MIMAKKLTTVRMGKEETGFTTTMSPDRLGDQLMKAITKILGEEYTKHTITMSFEGKRDGGEGCIRNLVLNIVDTKKINKIITQVKVDPEAFMSELKKI